MTFERTLKEVRGLSHKRSGGATEKTLRQGGTWCAPSQKALAAGGLWEETGQRGGRRPGDGGPVDLL